MMLFLALAVKPLMTLTTVLYLSSALLSGHLAMMLMVLATRRYASFLVVFNRPRNILGRVDLFLSMALCLLLRLGVFRRQRLKIFFQAEDGIRDLTVTGVQTCALPIYPHATALGGVERIEQSVHSLWVETYPGIAHGQAHTVSFVWIGADHHLPGTIVDAAHRDRKSVV